ncbi:Eco57I restriction-modification methylase domain-containing protein [Robertmurraya massiliosenegalensis]|uniref:Eco57I restriction-modification methylase domain-containing protein n=1 Tax=Robertmurraya massiliosenegalensis TaxID=1287657 RepID=UPI0002E14E81|nr:Eco57I restriction-modification methylase domain-containing protein [Robertmurraya massiliosenegalensis]
MAKLKRELIKDVFEAKFNLEAFKKLMIELFNGNIIHHKTNGESMIEKEYQEHIKSFHSLFTYETNGKKVLILTVELFEEIMIKRSRNIQRNFVAKLLEINEYDAAIVAFYSAFHDDWRLSFVNLEYEFTEKGLTKKITHPRRSSFLVGQKEPSHTAKKQLLTLFSVDEPTFEDMENAFSVEMVTKEFFDKYKEKYLELKDHLDNDKEFLAVSAEKGFNSEEFAKKLLGQIAFLYFLQKKGWLGVQAVPEKLSTKEFTDIFNTLETEDARDIFSKSFSKRNHDDYVLHKKMIKELSEVEAEILAQSFKGTKHYKQFGKGDKSFIRNLFNQKDENSNYFNDYLEPLFYEALNQKRGETHYYTPFNMRIPFLNGGLFEPLEGYNWRDNDFHIPDFIFSNKDETGILDVFDLYNFTINESEPLETEVAIDPEMLGKIFENLLEISDRKSKGAYYTPREIVHYMCQESLINFIWNKLGIDKDDLRKFVEIHDIAQGKLKHFAENNSLIPESIINNCQAIDNALENVKIADPAVGSGAFALGMLIEIVKIRSNLTPLMSKNIDEEELQSFYRSRTPYHLKLKTMQNNIFAVDIDFSATDITKLRLWLSLIVDDEINTVNPLPNLECNIKTGNSLIQEFKGIKLFDDKLLKARSVSQKGRKKDDKLQLDLFKDQREEILKNLNSFQRQLFNEHDKDVKNDLKNKIEKLEWILIEYELDRNKNQEGLALIEKLKKQRSKPFFLWKQVFSEIFMNNGGFDIVIGNPPYGAKVSKEEKLVIQKKMIDTNNSNSASVFIDYSKNYLLNEQGILSFIVPKSLLYSEKWFSLVQALNRNTEILVDVEKAFEKVKLEQVVFIYNKNFESTAYTGKKFIDKKFVQSTSINNDLVNKFRAWICDVKVEDLDIVNSLKNDLIPMSKISTTKRGVGLQKFLKDEGDIPVVGGKNLDRFMMKGHKGYIAKDMIEGHQTKLAFMQQPKIMSQDLVAHIQNPVPRIRITSCYDLSGKILSVDTVQNTVITDDHFDGYFIEGLLNSNFVSWYTYKFIYCSAIRTMHFDNGYIGKIVIPAATKDQQRPIIEIVKNIHRLNESSFNGLDEHQSKEIKKYINELNTYVYNLYGLTANQIEVIERTFR